MRDPKLLTTSAATLAVCLALSACKDSIVGEPEPDDDTVTECNADIAQRAVDVLDQYCFQCHGQNGTANGNINYITDADRLHQNGFLVRGSAEDSRIYRRMSEGTMPPAVVAERPESAETEIIRQWIECNAPTVGEDSLREFISTGEMLLAMREDLEQFPSADRPFLRYVSLVNLHNDPGVSNEDLLTYRHGLSMLANSLSLGDRIIVPDALVRHDMIYRIDLRDYQWDREVGGQDRWEVMLGQYPYGIRYSGNPDADFLHEETGSAMPFVNGDWFVFKASEPPLYYDMLQMPLTLAVIQQELGVDTSGPLASAGQINSGVSTANRVVYRHQSDHGAFWGSWDFSGSTGNRNILTNPLPPGGGFPEFEHQPDGGEFIFSLPNGLHGFMITDAAGERLDAAPTNIVFDRHDEFDAAVRSGRKCSKCHADGIIFATDSIRDHVLSSGVFPDEVVERVRAIFPPAGEFEQLQLADQDAFKQARSATGVPEGVQGHESVPIGFLADAFQTSVDLGRAAADFGMQGEEFRAAVEGSPALREYFGPLLAENGSLKRDTFRDAFPFGACVLGLGEPFINGQLLSCNDIPEPGTPIPVCGNGTAEWAEACDMEDLRSETCGSVGFDNGELACTSECALDTSGCGICGDGVVVGAEQCDGADLDGQTCVSQGFDSGTLGCESHCTFDLGGCEVCGNDVRGGAEQCDGSDVGGETCMSLGFDIGVLQCEADCSTYDVSGCANCSPPAPGATIYVNAATGINGPQFGASPACPVRTLDYALSVADGDIMVAAGDYPIVSTIVLGTGQQLICDPADPARIMGQPLLGTSHKAIRLSGNGSGVQNCMIEGEGTTPGYCIDIDGTNALVSGTMISNCGGAAIRSAGTAPTYLNNVIDNDNSHMFFQLPYATATAIGNTFIGTPQYNVHCNESTAQIAGSGNTGTEGCNPNCHCPAGFF